MKVRCFQYVVTPLVHPFFFWQSLTHGTTSVPAGIIVDLQMPTVFAHTDIGTISSGLAVDDAVGNFGLLWGRCIFIKVPWIKLKKESLYGWLTHSTHQLPCQRDSERQAMLCC